MWVAMVAVGRILVLAVVMAAVVVMLVVHLVAFVFYQTSECHESSRK